MTTASLYPNTFQHHNIYIDRISFYLSGNEEKVLNHVIREILGFQSNAASREASIAVSVLVNGKISKKTGERISWGCGLKQGAVRKALNTLCEFGLLDRVGPPTQDGQRYRLQLDFERVNFSLMKQRKAEKDATFRNQMRNARINNPLLLNNTPPVEQEAPPPVQQEAPPPVEQEAKNPVLNSIQNSSSADAENTPLPEKETSLEFDDLFPRNSPPTVDLPPRVDLSTAAGRAAYQERLLVQRRARLTNEPWLTHDTAHTYRARNGVSAEAQRRVNWLIAEHTGLACNGGGWNGWAKGLTEVYLEGRGKWDVIEAGIKAAWKRELEYRPTVPQGFVGEVRKALALKNAPAQADEYFGPRTFVHVE